MRSGGLVMAVKVGVAAVAVALSTTAGAVGMQPREAPGHGAAGIGDPYYPLYGNGGYRVSHYGIDVTYRPGSGRLTGTTVIKARATQRLSRFDLDFLLRTTSVTVNGARASFVHRPRHELVVTPASTLARGDAMRIRVTYSDVPEDVNFSAIGGWFSPHRGALALGEPEIAVLWFPSNDHPRDKARFDITVRVPHGVEAISNGRLNSVRQRGAERVWRWHVGSPMATYLAFLAIGQYQVERGVTPSGLHYLNAYAGRLGRYETPAKRSVRTTPLIAEWESGIFGPYPFKQIGGVIPPFPVGFALENQTRPVHSKLFFDGQINTYVIAHETAHQWFGDSVSVHNWKDTWLNEGFATYAEWLWTHYTGFARPNQIFRYDYRHLGRHDDFWKLEVGDPGPGREFEGPVYERGAMTLQAIHNVVGERAFGRILRGWARSQAGSNGSTPEFRRLAERIGGKDLGHVFHVWLHTTRRPAPTAANGFPVSSGQQKLSVRDRSQLRTLMRTTSQLARAEGR
jgi:aminopeptidase N